MQAKDRIAINTIVMYGRYIISFLLVLFSSRWVLLALGEEDFGIYSLIAGLLSMLMFLNITLSSSVQRFLSFAQGKEDRQLLDDTFKISLVLHSILALIVFILIETIGIWLLNNYLQIPDGKMDDAYFVLHTLSIGTVFTVLTVPFYAALLSHENIIFITVVTFIETLLKFCSAYALLYYGGNRLRLYSIIIISITFLSSILYFIYCRLKYNETRIRFPLLLNKDLLKKILSYSSWNLIGGVSSLARTQGVSLLMNSFLGVIVNAAYGIATQVQGQLSYITSAILTAARPQIVKSEGMGNRQRLHALVNMTCKSSFLLLTLFAIPLFVEMPYVLKIWLKEVPQYTTAFTQIVLLTLLVTQLSQGVEVGIESVGNIKLLQLIVGGMHFVVIPVGYILLRMGLKPEYVLCVVLAEEFINTFFRLQIARKVTGMDVIYFFKRTLVPCILVALINFTILYLLTLCLDQSLMRLIVSCCISIIIVIPLSFLLCLTKDERNSVLSLLIKIKNRFIH